MLKNLCVEKLREVEDLTVLSNLLYRNNRESYDVNDLLETLTITKMIEILYEYDCDISIESSGNTWYVSVASHINTEDEELIYALLEAVKITMEK